jgi:hypothetical protein
MTWKNKSSTRHCSNSFSAVVLNLYTKRSAVSISHPQEIGSNLRMQWPESSEHVDDGKQEVGQDIH